MPSRKKDSPEKNPTGILFYLLTIPVLTLIAIGNGVRRTVAAVFTAPVRLTGFAVRLFYEIIAAVGGWLKEKRPRMRIRATPSPPDRTDRIRSLWADALKTTGRILTTRVAVPKFPFIRLPKFSVPKFHIRIYSFRLPTLHLPPRQKPAIRRELPGWISQIKPFVIGVLLTVFVVFVPYNAWLFLQTLPNPQLLTERDIEVSTKILDRNGQLLYEIYTDQNRTPVKLTDIPNVVKEATIAIEDGDFYHHPGFSVRGIVRAASEIAMHKKIQGGSTITQQLIKSALLTPEVTLVRKTKEIILAFWAERIYSKDRILEMYLNQVPYGGTAWGIESAAQTYFHKSVTQLTLAEAALLAGLPQAPSEYSPFGAHPESAIARQHEVLLRMVYAGYITEDQMKKALSEPLKFPNPGVGIRAPHFVMYVKDLLEKSFGSRLVERGGLRVTTSLDLSLQEKTEYIVKTHVDNLRKLSVGNGAAVVTDPSTGDILAMVGSRDYFDRENDGNVNVAVSLRQPGSSIKVITYAAALERGLTASSLINDAPVVYQTAGSPAYAPVNYDGRFHGPVPLRYALANSYNIPAVKTLAYIGLPAMIEKAELMGVTTWTDPSRFGLSLTLGGGDVTMLDMATVYGTLANLGRRVDLRPILEVRDYTGRVLESYKPSQPVEAVKPDVAWILSDILADNSARSAAFGTNSLLVLPGKTVSVKTGTTNDKRDNWTAGYTPSYVAVVWVGNNDNSPMHPTLTSGITGASPIWHDIMAELLKDRPNESYPKPETIVSVPCYYNKVEYFLTGTEPPAGKCATIPTITPTSGPR